ncbi:MAG TPA: HypC/HybG/HupF family hydrogenase formation chaperone [bacterium]|jgi:hydrogenase expression/formation protein HypC|nr:HypC/HybG/HupF family hydrogenase formation chaperone [bacterium]HNT65488.1 HypC/HybG/HupF family hydrogenase formation chaperone [bacterium]HOX87553.1 HypC/HybG/HupF family hydrogenase formation chaperone [bacterium]HPG47263.1 HypC/HybG/HupF family hydrogenase formation chaperone [bacterium]HPM99531.1 HypC/HybG/HupF family hydrogenase formation chaperone [bacterium]
MCLAVPGKIIELTHLDPENRLGIVDFGGIRKSINLTFLPEAQVGDYVTVHVGFGLSIMDSEEARLVLEHLEQIGQQNQQKLDENARRFPRSGKS